MPLGIFREALPSVAGSYSGNADSAVGAWLPSSEARHRSHVHTSFIVEPEITTCQEGFRCVSRIGRFGTDHTKEVQPSNCRAAQAENTPSPAVDGKEGGDAGDGKDGPAADEYEYNCPVGNLWVRNRFEKGNEVTQCKSEKDCICIANGSENSYTELKDGIEKRHDTVDAEVGCGGGKTVRVPLIVIPHYPIRKMPDAYDPLNVNSDIGPILEMPRTEWVNSFKSNAPKLQAALDTLTKWAKEQYETKIADKPLVCGPPVPGMKATMNPEETVQASTLIRNLEVLQKDCERMRDTVPMLISWSNELVSPPGQDFLPNRKNMNCYKLKDSNVCRQLNCYTGNEDSDFKDHLREFEARIGVCLPEENEDDAPPVSEKAGVDTKKSGLGAGAAALAVLMGSSRAELAAGASKRNSWQRFL